jgi:hypothetical protein
MKQPNLPASCVSRPVALSRAMALSMFTFDETA